MDEIEAGGIPVVMLRGDGQINPDGIRDYDLLVPATVEALVIERHADARDALRSATPTAGARRSSPSTAVDPASPATREGAPPADDRRAGARSTTRSSARSAPGWSSCSGVGPDDDEATADDARPQGAPSCGSSATTDGRTNRSLLDVGGSALVVSQFTLYADTRRGRRPGFTGAAPPELAERLYLRFAAALAAARA